MYFHIRRIMEVECKFQYFLSRLLPDGHKQGSVIAAAALNPFNKP